jgi:hypothetical protein
MTRHPSAGSEIVVDRRQGGRRNSADRRRVAAGESQPQNNARANESRPVVQRQTERRAKVERRRQIDPTTCERDYTPDQVDFMKAMDLYKRRSGRQFPTWSEVLEVIEHLGYRKVAPPTEIYKHAE